KIKELHPNLPSSEVSKAVGALWRSLTDEQKTPYVQRADAAKELYDAKMKIYNEATGGVE
ncbi:hypothetical protein MKW92_019156, partial [Papaver armeniacum]